MIIMEVPFSTESIMTLNTVIVDANEQHYHGTETDVNLTADWL